MLAKILRWRQDPPPPELTGQSEPGKLSRGTGIPTGSNEGISIPAAALDSAPDSAPNVARYMEDDLQRLLKICMEARDLQQGFVRNHRKPASRTSISGNLT